MTTRPSATAWLAELRGGRLSARELTEQTLGAITAADGRLNAVTDLDADAALAAADAADAARRGGETRPLLGLPVTIKDVLDVSDRRTSAGSLARAQHRATGDATVVARLREAGAILVAKTNVPECSCSFETDNVMFGRTDNPLDPARTPGGSSGGEAALLGADASIAGIGTDGGGSIRVPSHYTGIVGLRPTTGRTPETGLWPPTRDAGTLDFTCVGPMARHVEDLELLLGVIGGAGLRAAVAAAGGRHHPQFAALLAEPDGPPRTAAEYLETMRQIHAFRARVRETINRHDVVLSPVVTGPAPRHGEPPAGVPAEAYMRYQAFEYVHINAVAGVPAASVPVGIEDGLPIGVQIAGPAFREDLVLAAARELERVTGGCAINAGLRAGIDV